MYARRLFFAGLAIGMMFGLAGCGFMQYSVLTAYPVALGTGASPEAATIWQKFQNHPEKTVKDLGRALARLPDVSDGLTSTEIQALGSIYDLAADPGAGPLLAELAYGNQGKYQFSGALQGLLWMAEIEDITRRPMNALSNAALLDYAWESLPARLKTPEDILEYLASNYSYILNRQSAKTKRQFFRDKNGDCTEYTLLGGYLLTKKGYTVYALTSRPSFFGNHVSLIFEKDGTFWLMDGSRAATTRALRMKKGLLSPVDVQVLSRVQTMDHMVGPTDNKQALIDAYAHLPGAKVPSRIIDYQTYERHIEAFGMEDLSWFNF